MTLFKQIALLISSVLLVLLLVVIANDLSNTGKVQQELLNAMSRDMAATLGIAIDNLPNGEDQSALKSLIDSAFESGYYTRIELISPSGETIHQISRPSTVKGVPAWFADAVSLKGATGSVPVTQGSIQLGSLNLEVNPGYAYRSSYQSLISTLGWFVLFFAISLALLWILLHRLLKPLQMVKQQADAIHNNQFVQQERLPTTIELKTVVEAMNFMIARVQGVFDEQERTLNRYQQLLYRDKITNLGNRRYLLEQLQQSMSEESGLYNCMAIIKIVDFDQLRDSQGYEESNKLIRILAELLRKGYAGHNADRLSRFNDDEFAFLSAADEEAAVEFIAALFEAFQARIENEPALAEVKLLAGICDLNSEDQIGSILANIDYCLSCAGARGPFSIEFQVSKTLNLPQGKMQWRGWLESSLKSGKLFLVGQLAISNDRIPNQREIFVRIRDDRDQVIPASAFLPMAASLGISHEIDREVFRLVESNRNLDRGIPLAINLSAAFFELAEAQQEFNQLLETCERQDTRLCIEANHHVLIQYPAMCSQVSNRVRKYRHRFGVDNLDFGLSLQLLQTGQFDYIKINAQILQDMIQGDMTASIQALRTLADTLDIHVIAVAVDSQKVYNDLKELGIQTMQGNFLGPPEEI